MDMMVHKEVTPPITSTQKPGDTAAGVTNGYDCVRTVIEMIPQLKLPVVYFLWWKRVLRRCRSHGEHLYTKNKGTLRGNTRDF